jgi:putative phosphoesterase
MARIGLISDTHGLLRPEATAFLRGSDHIVHAGDIGHAAVLQELARLAPVTAVRGNNDREPWADAVRETEVLEVGEVSHFSLVTRMEPLGLSSMSVRASSRASSLVSRASASRHAALRSRLRNTS